MSILHAEVARDLHAASAELSASEAHGCLCGAMCALGDYAFDQWLAEIGPDERQADDLARSGSPLRALFESSLASLRADAMQFAPLLPDDDVSLAERTAALAEWTQGFLYGLATGRLGPESSLPVVVREVLADFGEISRAIVGTEDAEGAAPDDESDEQAYAELHEFVRAGTQLVFDELSVRRP